jgi:hypothetical protein
MFTELAANTKAALFEALNYLNMEELTAICSRYQIPIDGKKGQIIERLKCFIDTGKIIKSPPLPAISKAKSTDSNELNPLALILSGLYKNDDRTRQFMKSLVGEHFHFTAFGQDWIKARWQAGKPPTYQEFAEVWQAEYVKRNAKGYKPSPKAEWAYLNFIQRYSESHPKASKAEISQQWEIMRANKASYVLRNLLD